LTARARVRDADGSGVWRPDGRLRQRTGQAGLPAEVRVSGRGEHEGGSNSVVESQPSKLLVAGSIPVSRSNLRSREQA
jgi:hypothetical protein